VVQPSQLLEAVSGLYYRLVLLVGPAGSGKTPALHGLAAATGGVVVNVNLELSRRMLELTERQRALQVGKLLDEVVGPGDSVVLLDNVELLFDPALRQDPLRLFQALSRRRTAVVAWNGLVEDGYLTYAEPDHREYRRYPAADLTIVGPTQLAQLHESSHPTTRESN
jgi:hypothetical protein